MKEGKVKGGKIEENKVEESKVKKGKTKGSKVKGGNFTGTGVILRMFFRRDRLVMPIWIFLPLLIFAGQVSFIGAMPDWQEFITELSANPLASAWLGPIVPLSKEGAILWRGMLQSAMVVMLGSAFTAIRHTRSEEQAGRSELVFGQAAGRYAPLTAALILCLAGSLVAGLLVSVLLISNGFAATGSWLAGLTIAAAGWLFAGISVLAAQLYEDAGSARGVVFALLFASFIPMVLDNTGGGDTAWVWLVPESWFRLTVPFGENNFWPLVIFAVLSVIPIGLSYITLSRRDLGAGLFQSKPGPAEAAPGLSSPLGLAWRQHKNTIMSWTIGMIFIGGSLGIITPNIAETISSMLVEMNTWAATMARLGNREGFIAISIYLLGLMAGTSVYGIMTVLKLKEEEREHFAEIVLARPVSRTQWMGSYLIIAFAGSVVILFALGMAAGLGWGIASGNMALLPRALIMSLSKIPPVWIIIGIAAMLYGWLPRASSILSWIILGSFIIIEIFWEAGLVGWSVLQVSPFAYAHYSIPINELSILPLLALILLSAVFTAIGMIGFKRRSIGM